MSYGETSDANFFALVHHVLEAQRHDEPTERRDSQRHKFSCRQFIAPYRDGRLPAHNEFQRVQCQDLSPTGLSFLSDSTPETQYLIVALGNAPFIFLSAEVVHAVPVEDGGKVTQLIGCRFISRIKEADLGARLTARSLHASMEEAQE